MNLEQHKIRLRVPAKINLSLDIVGRKENGYHLLEMVMQSIGLYDEISLSILPAKKFCYRITCNRPWIPTDERNIVYKAAAAFFGEKLPDISLHINIYKHIPDQAGMAGGSADAAGVLVGLNMLYDNVYTEEKLREIGLTVGADVPYCIHGGTAFVSGIGEQIADLPALTDGYIVGARPKVGISTKAAYQGFDNAHPGVVQLPSSAKTEHIVSAVKSGDLNSIALGMFNVFEDVCGVQEVENLKVLLLKMGAVGAMMTGSGSVVFGIFSRQLDAQNAYESLKNTQPDVFFASISGKMSVIADSD